MKLAMRVRRQPDGQFRAWCPALPGCITQGSSEDDVMRKMDLTVRAYLDSLNSVTPVKLDQQLVEA